MSLYTVFQTQWSDKEKIVLVTESSEYTWSDLDRLVRQGVQWLAEKEILRGDILALQMPKDIEFQALVLASLASGITVLPLNPSYTATEIRHALTDSKAKLGILLKESLLDASYSCETLTSEDMGPILRQCVPKHTLHSQPLETIGFLCYTSGTTGQPKGALIRQGNVLATLRALHKCWHWSSNDTLIHALPMFHIHGLFVAQFGAYFAGATTHWVQSFSPESALFLMKSVKNGIFMGVPTFYHRFIESIGNAAITLPNMRLFTSGSAPLPATVHAQFESLFGHRILERYGMTEIGIVLSNPYDGPRKPGTVGLPLQGVQARIHSPLGDPVAKGDIGELHIKGASVMAGYFERPQANQTTLIDRWMHTGDLARQDDDGFFQIIGRHTDMIISGGLNVYPREVETRLLEHPSIVTAAVIGLDDPDFGERVVAVVTTQRHVVDVDATISFCKTNLAPYKCPKEIKQIETLPRNAMGKVQKHLLRTLWPLYGPTQWDPAIQSALLNIIQAPSKEVDRPLAVFDFDNTCIAGDIGEAVLIALQQRRGTDYLSYYQKLCEEEGRVVGYKWCAAQCAGLSAQEMQALTETVFLAAVRAGDITVRPGIFDLIAALKAADWEVWIVTASAEVIVQGISKYLGLPPERVLGMKLPTCPKTQVLLPEILAPATIFQGKLDAILKYIGRTPHIAVGDSDTDFEMIESAQLGIVIDRGQPKLRRLAQNPSVWLQADWTTLSME